MQKFLKQLSPLMKLTPARSLQTATPFINLGPMRYYKQVKDLNQVVLLAEEEEEQRKAKFLEYTQKVYKPSKTIVFDRNGELLLYSCDNFAKSQIYLKYPYVMYDAMIPLATYIFFCDPCKELN